MKVGIIGANGFIGSAIYNLLKDKYDQVDGITRGSYEYYKHNEYDVLINTNGNSRKFWANNNPKEDFVLSVQSVYNALFDFRFKKYIQISSIDSFESSVYGNNKSIVEHILKQYVSVFNLSIIRCPQVIGKNMQKGVVADILNGKSIFLQPDSKLNLITNIKVAEIIQMTISKNLVGNYNIGSTNSVTIKAIAKILGKSLNLSTELRFENYSNYYVSNTMKPYLKTAEAYLKEII